MAAVCARGCLRGRGARAGHPFFRTIFAPSSQPNSASNRLIRKFASFAGGAGHRGEAVARAVHPVSNMSPKLPGASRSWWEPLGTTGQYALAGGDVGKQWRAASGRCVVHVLGGFFESHPLRVLSPASSSTYQPKTACSLGRLHNVSNLKQPNGSIHMPRGQVHVPHGGLDIRVPHELLDGAR